MKDRIVTAVNGISTVDICGDSIAITGILSENVNLVRRSMRPENSIFVDVIGVGPTASGMVRGEAE
jgi:hypothetical protein